MKTTVHFSQNYRSYFEGKLFLFYNQAIPGENRSQILSFHTFRKETIKYLFYICMHRVKRKIFKIKIQT